MAPLSLRYSFTRMRKSSASSTSKHAHPFELSRDLARRDGELKCRALPNSDSSQMRPPCDR